MQNSVSCHTSNNVQGLRIVADGRLASELDTRVVDASTVRSDSTMRQSSDEDAASSNKTALAWMALEIQHAALWKSIPQHWTGS